MFYRNRSPVHLGDHLPHDDLHGEECRHVSPDFLHQRQKEGCSTEEREETGGGFDVKISNIDKLITNSTSSCNLRADYHHNHIKF